MSPVFITIVGFRSRCLLLVVFMRVYLFLARYWKDPHMFKPSRFLDDWPRDAFIPFSAGKYGPLKHLLPELIHRNI
jgi:hypothetical protein